MPRSGLIIWLVQDPGNTQVGRVKGKTCTSDQVPAHAQAQWLDGMLHFFPFFFLSFLSFFFFFFGGGGVFISVLTR